MMEIVIMSVFRQSRPSNGCVLTHTCKTGNLGRFLDGPTGPQKPHHRLPSASVPALNGGLEQEQGWEGGRCRNSI